ncbi:MAG: hypothetical protein OXF27_00450 [Acidobacteria bacterium]|nr:hypothetical protein [Acidobacteriota bacterium]
MPSSINVQGSKISIEVEVKNFLLGVKLFADAAVKQSKSVEAYGKSVKSFGKAVGSFGKAQGQQQKFLSGVLDLLKRMQQARAGQALPPGAEGRAAARKLFDDRRAALFKENLPKDFDTDQERVADLDEQLKKLKEKTGLQADYAKRLQAVIDLEKHRATLENNSLAAAQAAVRARTKELRAANDAAQVERVRRGRDPGNIDRKRERIRERYETEPGAELQRIEDELVRKVQADLFRREQELRRRVDSLTARVGALASGDPESRRLTKQAGAADTEADRLETARNDREGIENQLGGQVVEQKIRNHVEQMQRSMKLFRDLSEGAATILIDGLAKAVAEAENLKEAFKKIGIELLKLAVQKLVIDQAKGLLSNALDSLFGIPGKAAGGPVAAGRLYMVGERGKELFRPQVAGEIVPNYKLRPALAGAGGNAFNFSINIQSSDGPGVRAALAEAVPVIEERVSRAVKGEVQADLARPSALRGAARG